MSSARKTCPTICPGPHPTQVSRCKPSGWNKDVSPQPWSLKPVVYWCCQSPCSDRYHLPQMGLQHTDSKLRSGYVEGYGTSEDMNCLRGCDHLLHLPLKFISKLTCDEAWRVCESLVWELWGKCTNTWTSTLEEMDCVTTSQLSEQHAFPAIPRFSDSPLRSLLWRHVVSVVSNKEEILVPSWPAHRGHRKIYGVCLLHRGCFWTEADINNTSPVHPSPSGSSFMLWSTDFI